MELRQNQRDCSVDVGFKALQAQVVETENKLEEMTNMKNQWKEKSNNVSILYERLKQQIS